MRIPIAEYCGNCISFEQGKTCCFCGNIEQKDEALKRYVYYKKDK